MQGGIYGISLVGTIDYLMLLTGDGKIVRNHLLERTASYFNMLGLHLFPYDDFKIVIEY